MKVMMSIKPEYVEKILDGTKTFEFRKKRCKNAVDSIIIYATAPIMKVVAEVKVVGIIQDTPQVVWQQTASRSGISKAFFDSYFSGHNTAVAYVLGCVEQFHPPRNLSEYKVTTAPQSYRYLH